jgi:hypothetical protein
MLNTYVSPDDRCELGDVFCDEFAELPCRKALVHKSRPALLSLVMVVSNHIILCKPSR